MQPQSITVSYEGPMPAGRGTRTYTRLSIVERLWRKVNQTLTCWMWGGALTHFGHGKIGRGGKSSGWIQAHVVAWFDATGRWPEGDERVLHTCDVPACVRNDDEGVYIVDGVTYERRGHLWLGTTAANLADMRAKGRGRGLVENPDWWQGKHRDGLRGRLICP